MSSVRPGTCCTLVYTSGTTGNPKGVILSHDNYSWTAKRMIERDDFGSDAITKMVSYLPLSHVASQIIDIILSMLKAAAVYFADEKALQGTLIQTL
jgi:long-chain-fatty-acid--CoA ligase ACSBG